MLDNLPQAFQFEPLTEPEVQAIKAMRSGEATPEQQGLMLSVVINKFSRSHDLCYVPNDTDQTAFLNGRAFVGQQVLKILNVPIGKLIVEQQDVS